MAKNAWVVAAAVLSAAASAQADHWEHTFQATIQTIEGTAPHGVFAGGGVTLLYTLNRGTPDANPAPGIGLYPNASRLVFGFVSGYGSRLNFDGDAVHVENNQGNRDLFHFYMQDPKEMIATTISLYDAESSAFASEGLPSSLQLADFTGEFDVATFVVESTDPSRQWRLNCTIDSIQSRRVFCRCDWNDNGALNSQDMFDFLQDFFQNRGDFNLDGITNSQDFFDFFTCFFAGGADCT